MNFSIKIINPNNCGGETVIKKLELLRYQSVETLKIDLVNKFSQYTEGHETEFGYIIPGHGMKGKQKKLDTL